MVVVVVVGDDEVVVIMMVVTVRWWWSSWRDDRCCRGDGDGDVEVIPPPSPPVVPEIAHLRGHELSAQFHPQGRGELVQKLHGLDAGLVVAVVVGKAQHDRENVLLHVLATQEL
jgi:hypothetical protein